DYLGGDRGGSDPVDYETERRPPASVCDELAAVLPEVLEPVGGEAEHEQPWRSGDRRRGDDDEGSSDAALNGDHGGPSIGDREADVHGSDQREAEGVHGRRIEPPEGQRRRGLEGAPHESPA